MAMSMPTPTATTGRPTWSSPAPANSSTGCALGWRRPALPRRPPMTADPRLYQPAPDLLAGRVIMVTGAGAGIGRAAALAYASHGATVILAGRTTARLEAVYDDIVAAGGPEPAIVPVDLAGATLEDCRHIAERIDSQLGRLDGLLHNAGVLGERKRIEDTSPESWEEVLRVNVSAAFLLTRALLPLLKAAPDASLIFTSSGVGRQGRAWWGAYAVSKFATEGLMQVLADELGSSTSVRVNRSEEHTSELQSRGHLVCRLLLEKKKPHKICALVKRAIYFLCKRRRRLRSDT